jgi:hypothetical protein
VCCLVTVIRHTHLATYKAYGAVVALRSDKTIADVVEKYEVHAQVGDDGSDDRQTRPIK